MDYFFLRLTLIGSLLSTIGACTAGNYDLPACGDSEICSNGKDDDCDGIRDNPEVCSCATVGATRTCPPRVGVITKTQSPTSICTDVAQNCRSDFQWSECLGIEPIPEQCANGLDDDCDGIVDEAGCVPCIDNQEQNVYDPNLNYGPNSKCTPKREICKSGQWETKTEAPVPSVDDKTCDGKDDDCDGKLDENAEWQSLSKTFIKGEVCWDLTKVGACRTVGTVDCNTTTGMSFCNNTPRNPVSIYQKVASTDALFDPTNPIAVWDWDCDGKTESLFCTGAGATCGPSNISKTVFVAYDTSTDCSVVKVPNCMSSVLIRSIIPGTSIQCGSAIQVTECEPPIIGVNCRDRPNPVDGFMYCK